MSDKKISELNSLTGANAADGDLVAIVDVSATETKKITRSEFFTDTPSIDVGGTVTATGLDINGNADVSGNITLSKDGSSAISRGDDLGLLRLIGGTTTSTGASIVLTGGSKATQPDFIFFNADSVSFRPVATTPEFLSFADGTGAVFNENGADVDFRIESDTNAYAFFLQGSDGKVGIGTSTPLQPLHVNSSGNTQLLISSSFNNSTNTGLTVDTVGDSSVFKLSATKSGVGRGTLSFLHNSTASLEAWNLSAAGSVVYNAGYSEHVWKTGNTERMRINSDGYVGIGTSSPAARLEVADTSGASGIEVSAYRNDTVYGNSYVQFNGPRSSNADGEKADGRGAITLIGNDIDNGSSLWINAQSSGLNPEGYDDAVFQSKQAGLNINSAGELSFWKTNAQRFLIDTGGRAIIPAGVTLGTAAGTYSAANTLDDYEEGTWTPEYTGQSGQPSAIVYDIQEGYYTKVGSVVTVSGRISTTSITGSFSGNIRISGLPFSCKDVTSLGAGGGLVISSATDFAGNFPFGGYARDGVAIFTLQTRADFVSDTFVMLNADMATGAGNNMSFSATYITDQ